MPVHQFLNPGIPPEYIVIIRLDKGIVGLAGRLHLSEVFFFFFFQGVDTCRFVLIRVATDTENPQLLQGKEKRVGRITIVPPAPPPLFSMQHILHQKAERVLLFTFRQNSSHSSLRNAPSKNQAGFFFFHSVKRSRILQTDIQTLKKKIK